MLHILILKAPKTYVLPLGSVFGRRHELQKKSVRPEISRNVAKVIVRLRFTEQLFTSCLQQQNKQKHSFGRRNLSFMDSQTINTSETGLLQGASVFKVMQRSKSRKFSSWHILLHMLLSPAHVPVCVQMSLQVSFNIF